jgi:hypothetical protein
MVTDAKPGRAAVIVIGFPRGAARVARLGGASWFPRSLWRCLASFGRLGTPPYVTSATLLKTRCEQMGQP